MSPSIRITVTVPKEILNIQTMRKAIEGVVNDAGLHIHAMFNESTSTWNKRPAFTRKKINTAMAIGVDVFTSNPIYGLVNAGSPPHPIFPRRRGMLRFQSGYASKSKVGSRRSFAGGKFGDWTSRPFIPRHPGFEGRKFDELIAKDYTPVFERDVQDAINRGSR